MIRENSIPIPTATPTPTLPPAADFGLRFRRIYGQPASSRLPVAFPSARGKAYREPDAYSSKPWKTGNHRDVKGDNVIPIP